MIGIVSHNISKSGGSEGLGFVATVNTAKQLLLERRSFWTGLEGQLLSEELADLFNLPPKTVGFMVKTVAKNSPADEMGLRGGTKTAVIDGQPLVVGGDILLEVDGITVGTAADAARDPRSPEPAPHRRAHQGQGDARGAGAPAQRARSREETLMGFADYEKYDGIGLAGLVRGGRAEGGGGARGRHRAGGGAQPCR